MSVLIVSTYDQLLAHALRLGPSIPPLNFDCWYRVGHRQANLAAEYWALVPVGFGEAHSETSI